MITKLESGTYSLTPKPTAFLARLAVLAGLSVQTVTFDNVEDGSIKISPQWELSKFCSNGLERTDLKYA